MRLAERDFSILHRSQSSIQLKAWLWAPHVEPQRMPTTGAVLFDSDGTGGSAAIQFATLSAGWALQNDYFIVVRPNSRRTTVASAERAHPRRYGTRA
jgi:hypothetical protein